MVDYETRKMEEEVEQKCMQANRGGVPLMLDKSLVDMRNDVVKRIKMHQMKRKNLPNLVRIHRERILA